MILIHDRMSKEDMFNLITTREVTLPGLKRMCEMLKIDDSGKAPELRIRMLKHFAGEAVTPFGRYGRLNSLDII